ncbi:peptide chain release factor 1 [Candidatus Gracilibacteria bacterium]|nr:peptide chain release factor 1 [Candidatus Gracilibacteria bacterium]
MLDKLQSIIKKYESLKEQMMDNEIASDQQRIMNISKEMSQLEDSYNLSIEYKKYDSQLKEAQEILETESDSDILDMAQQQLEEAKEKLEDLDQKIKFALLPKDPNDDKDIYLEIRPAAGGDEAGLFGTELLKMYLMYAQKKGRKTEIVEEQMSDIGGVKLVIVRIAGESVYSIMKFESGVHRVQRIPETESQGRVHTSTVTVAIMPEAKDVDIKIDPKDIQMDTYAGSSAGGQNANKNQTGVRLHHLPSGLIVDIGDSKSQMHNKEKAFAVLKSRLYQIELDKKIQEEKSLRGNQIGSGDRSEKIRTYNYPQDRVTDHRIHESRSNLPSILMGNIEDILQKLTLENQTKLLEASQG